MEVRTEGTGAQDPGSQEPGSDATLNGGENGQGPTGPMSDRLNLLQNIRERHEWIRGEHHLDLPLPGYKNMLWARFKAFPVEKAEKKVQQLAQAQQQGKPILLAASCDTLIDACEEVMLLPVKYDGDIGTDGENLISIDEDEFVSIGFDSRLAQILELPNAADIKSARQVVISLFPTEQSIVAMSGDVTRWMQGNAENTQADLVRE